LFTDASLYHDCAQLFAVNWKHMELFGVGVAIGF
jgi:hypothetical protein